MPTASSAEIARDRRRPVALVARLADPTRLAPDPADESWEESALCAQVDPELFFPERGQPTWPAKKVCRGCDVRAECLQAALTRGEEFGIWGGTSARERAKLLRRVDRKAA